MNNVPFMPTASAVGHSAGMPPSPERHSPFLAHRGIAQVQAPPQKPSTNRADALKHPRVADCPCPAHIPGAVQQVSHAGSLRDGVP